MSDDNIVRFPGTAAGEQITYAEIPAETILNAALETKFQQLMVVGWTEDGVLYMAATTGYNPDNMALLDIAKQELISFYRGD